MDPFSDQYEGGPNHCRMAANGLWESEYDIGLSAQSTNALMQALSEAGTAKAPRGPVAQEKVREMFTNNVWEPARLEIEQQYFPEGIANPNTGYQLFSNTAVQRDHTQEPEPAYVTHSRASPHNVSYLPQKSRREYGPSPVEWEKRKKDIKYWYLERNYTCEETMEEMAKGGFIATVPMYKRMFGKKKWAINKYGQNPLNRRGRKSQHTSPGTIQVAMVHSSGSSSYARAVGTPPNFNLMIPTAMSNSKISGLYNAMLFYTKELYIDYLTKKKWKVENKRKVEEDIHDDLLVGVATSLRNWDSLGHSGSSIGFKGLRQSFQILDKVVGVQKGADCGLFSLPAIWESFLRMIRKQKPELARLFLLQAWRLAKEKFGPVHPFTQVLLNLLKIQKENPEQLADVISTNYRSCIEHVQNHLEPLHLTTLSLWADFIVYLDGSSINQIRTAVDNIQRCILNSKQENGPDHDYTIELLGLKLLALQSAPTMAGEAEEVALDMFHMLERIKAKTDGGLNEDLLLVRRDLTHALGTFKYNQKDYEKAIEYLGEFFHIELMDDRDGLALYKLEECYRSLGQLEKAEAVQKLRIETSKKLLQQDESQNPETATASIIADDMTDSANERSTDGTTIDDSENTMEEEDQDQKDDVADEIDDIEAEKQLVREQMSELGKKLEALEKRSEKGRKN